MKILFFIALSCFIQILQSDSRFYKTVNGKVAAGNFTYYTLLSEGPTSLILKSSKGDADLYVSQQHVRPTYEPENYCLHSATCGIDIVDVPQEFKRPVGIGVYGHPSHDESQYTLEIILKPEESPTFTSYVPDSTQEEFSPLEDNDDIEEDSTRKTLIYLFLETVLDMFLEIFLL